MAQTPKQSDEDVKISEGEVSNHETPVKKKKSKKRVKSTSSSSDSEMEKRRKS